MTVTADRCRAGVDADAHGAGIRIDRILDLEVVELCLLAEGRKQTKCSIKKRVIMNGVMT